MILAFVFILLLAALWIDALWLLSLFGAVAAMHWMASLHPADPLAPLYAFLAGAMAARLALEVLRRLATRLIWPHGHRARRRQGTLRFSP